VESDNSIWEQMNQEQLKEDYRYQLLNGGPKNFVRPVRRIVCGGCAKIFYTEVPTKKYCSERCCYLGFWRHKREKRLEKRKDVVCKTCGKTFTPKRSDAVYCSNACRQKAYRQNVTIDGSGSN